MKNRILAMLLLGFCTIACAEPELLVDADGLADHIEDDNLMGSRYGTTRTAITRLAISPVQSTW